MNPEQASCLTLSAMGGSAWGWVEGVYPGEAPADRNPGILVGLDCRAYVCVWGGVGGSGQEFPPRVFVGSHVALLSPLSLHSTLAVR